MRSSNGGGQDAKTFIEDEVFGRAKDYAPLLRAGEAFSHTTALLLLGVPVRCSTALHVTVPQPTGRARGRDIQGHDCVTPFTVTTVRGLPCTPAVLAATQAARLLDFKELVVALDHILFRRSSRQAQKAPSLASRLDSPNPASSPSATALRAPGSPRHSHPAKMQLEEELQRFSTRGILRLRAALQLARFGAESRMETLLRLELARMGLDDLELQVDIYDTDGTWIGRFDMADLERKLIIEYDGEQHRTNRGQYLRDEQRLEAARNAGYKILRVHAEDLNPHVLPATREQLCKFLGRKPRAISPAIAKHLMA